MDRYASVVVRDRDGGAIFSTEGYYRVAFECKGTMQDIPGDSVMCVYGLSDSECAAAINRGVVVELYAGENKGLIYKCDLLDASVIEENQQSGLVMVGVDGDSFFQSRINRSLTKGMTLGSVIEECAENCTSPIPVGFISQDAYSLKLPRGVSLFGSPGQYIKQIARTINAACYVSNGRLFVMGMKDVPKTAPFVVSGDSGLIGIPSRDAFYITFQHDIDSSLMVGRLVQIDDEYGGGIYRVFAVVSKGDTKEGDWHMSVSGISQVGDSPDITAATMNVWR